VAVPVDVPDLGLLAGKLARPDGRARIGAAQLRLELRRRDGVVLHRTEREPAEPVVARWIEDERRP
jgi:hypothetical protein